MYGYPWVTLNGKSPMDGNGNLTSDAERWLSMLSGMTPRDVANGLEACRDRISRGVRDGDNSLTFPPTYQIFFELVRGGSLPAYAAQSYRPFTPETKKLRNPRTDEVAKRELRKIHEILDKAGV